jgi:hypothetical protein
MPKNNRMKVARRTGTPAELLYAEGPAIRVVTTLQPVSRIETTSLRAKRLEYVKATTAWAVARGRIVGIGFLLDSAERFVRGRLVLESSGGAKRYTPSLRNQGRYGLFSRSQLQGGCTVAVEQQWRWTIPVGQQAAVSAAVFVLFGLHQLGPIFS